MSQVTPRNFSIGRCEEERTGRRRKGGEQRKEEGRKEGGRIERSVHGPKGPKSHGSVQSSSAFFIFEERQCTHPIKTDSFKVLKD